MSHLNLMCTDDTQRDMSNRKSEKKDSCRPPEKGPEEIDMEANILRDNC